MASNVKRILCILDGDEQIIYGTIRDTNEWSIGAECNLAKIIEEDCETPIVLCWWNILEVAEDNRKVGAL